MTGNAILCYLVVKRNANIRELSMERYATSFHWVSPRSFTDSVIWGYRSWTRESTLIPHVRRGFSRFLRRPTV